MKKIFYLLIAVLFVFTSNTTFAGDGDKWDTVTGTTKTGEDRYIESASTNGAKTNLNYSQSSNPGKVYIDTQSSFTVYNNSTFNLSVQTTDAMKWCHAIVFFDWNGDGTFEVQSEKIGYDSSDSNTGNLSSTGNTIVNNFNIDISVPGDATIGETRMRIQFTDAWHKKDTPNHQHSATDEIDQGGCYDFIMNIEARPTRTVTVMAGENGSATITAPSEAENGSITTSENVTVEATANEGYIFNNWTDKAGNIITANPYIYSGGEDIVLTAHFSMSLYEPEYTCEKNNDGTEKNPFSKYTDSYVETITLENGEQSKEWRHSNPRVFWNVLSNMEMTAKIGETINTHFVAHNLGAYNESQVLQDLRFTAVVLAIDWNGDGTFEYVEKIKGNTDPTNNIGGNANPEEGDGYVMDYTYAITVPETAVAGKKARVRFNYTNAWFGDKTAADFATVCKEGIVYDFDIVIEETEPLVNRTLKTIKTTLGGDENFSGNGFIIRGNIPSSIIGDSNEMTMGAWVKIGSPKEGGIDKGSYDWGDNDGSNTNLGKIVMGTRQNNITGFGSKPSFGVVVYGVNSTNDAYKLGVFMKEDAISTPVEVPTGWFHLAFTVNYNGTNTEMKMYVNGEYETSATLNGKFASLADFQDFCFGDNMNAEFDDIMIWKKVLDAEKIKSSMKGLTDNQIGFDISNSDFVCYYTCDDLTDEVAESNNLADIHLQSGKDIKLRRDKMTYNNASGQWATCSKSLYTETGAAAESERQIPRGGEKFFEGDAAATWLTNGDETDFGYILKTDNITRLTYNGVDKVALPGDVLAVYHNGDPGLPTYVTTSDIKAIDSSTATEPANSYVVGGIEYTMTMPSVAKTEWMPVSLPIGIDAVADIITDATKLLRPGYNFWYAQVSPDYLATNSGNIWETIKNQDGNYVLQPGIISVPEARINHKFTFFTQINKPVVIRKFNAQYNTSLLPEVGEMAFVQNPYGYKVNALKMAGIDAEGNGANLTIYRFNKTTGNFDPLDKTNIEAEGNTLNEFEPFFVHDSNNGVSQAPRYIGTKDVSGIVEFEAVYDVNVRGTENAVEVETFQNTEVQIYTLDGVMVAADEVEGTREFELPAGIYVVKTTVEGENKSFKVVVE